MKFSNSRVFPGQCQAASFFMAAVGIDSISLSMRRPYFWVKVTHQQWNVLRPLPKGRDANGKNIEPVIQISAKLTAFNHLFQVAVEAATGRTSTFFVWVLPSRSEFPLL